MCVLLTLFLEKRKAKICDLPIKEKRRFYKCGENYLTLKRIPTWAVFHKGKKKIVCVNELRFYKIVCKS